ncbi:MAG: nucleotidyltransferase family protein [Halobacteriota archaeon]
MARVVGVILAAGTATRFDGGNKLLVRYEDEALVRHAVRSLRTEAIEGTVAVVGDDRVAATLADLPVEVRTNPDPEAGLGPSVAIGAAAAAERGATAAAFLPGDMPCVAPATVDRLVEVHVDDPETVVVPVWSGRRGNPVVFPAGHFDRLRTLEDDVGGRVLLAEVPTTRVAVEDPGIHVDVDTRDDLTRLRQSGCDAIRS